MAAFERRRLDLQLGQKPTIIAAKLGHQLVKQPQHADPHHRGGGVEWGFISAAAGQKPCDKVSTAGGSDPRFRATLVKVCPLPIGVG